MKKNLFKYRRIPNITVGMQSQEDSNLQVLHGKVLLNEVENSLLFMQNSPRGPRSSEVMRTAHSRLVRTPQGRYTLTFRFSPNERNLKTILLNEMAKITDNELINRKETNNEV